VTRARRHRAAGVTLIELVASIVIVAVATIGLMTVVAATVGRSADPLVESQAQAVAQAYLEEIAQAAFCDPDFDPDSDPATGCRQECSASACQAGCGGTAFGSEGSRASFDDVCDYDALSDHGARDRLGAALAGLQEYTVDVRVRDQGITLGSPALASDAGQVLRVDVTVGHSALTVPYRVAIFRANVQ
jgi:MSHA pilin protein MshD